MFDMGCSILMRERKNQKKGRARLGSTLSCFEAPVDSNTGQSVKSTVHPVVCSVHEDFLVQCHTYLGTYLGSRYADDRVQCIPAKPSIARPIAGAPVFFLPLDGGSVLQHAR